jgi:hypothetical protein
MILAMAEIAYESSDNLRAPAMAYESSDDLWVPAMAYKSSAGLSDQRWPVSPAINYNTSDEVLAMDYE